MAVCVAGGAGLPGKRKCSDGLPVLSFVLLLAVALAGMATPSAAAVYKVGDDLGWTIQGNPNYTAWAESKSFNVGDKIRFEYNKQYHNVEEVSMTDFKSCNANKTMATYTSGNDSVTLKTVGHHFFLCGVPGHCGLGQKVDINVLQKASPAAPGPSPAASPGSPPSVPTGPSPAAGGPTAGAPPPPNSRAAPGSSVSYAVGWAAALLAVAVGANLN